MHMEIGANNKSRVKIRGLLTQETQSPFQNSALL